MLPRRRPDAVHHVYAEDESTEPLEPQFAGYELPEALDPQFTSDEPPEALEPGGVPGMSRRQPPFVGIALGLSRRRRVAAMTLLGAVLGVMAVLLAHGLHSPGAGSEVGLAHLPSSNPPVALHPTGGAGGVVPGGVVVRVPFPARQRRAPVARVGGEAGRARSVSVTTRVEAAPAIHESASSAAPAVASEAVAQATGSEFGFER